MYELYVETFQFHSRTKKNWDWKIMRMHRICWTELNFVGFLFSFALHFVRFEKLFENREINRIHFYCDEVVKYISYVRFEKRQLLALPSFVATAIVLPPPLLLLLFENEHTFRYLWLKNSMSRINISKMVLA